MNEITKVSQDTGGSLLNFVAQAVSDPNVDVAKLEALLRMQREIVADQAKVTFNRQLHAAQAVIRPIAKNGTVTLGDKKGSYAFTTWEDMDKVLRPIMEQHGFTLTYTMETKDGGGAVITGTLLHVDGHSKSASIPLALDSGPGRNNLQAMGSTMSYGRRYVAEMLFNLVRKGEDDDGKSGGAKFIQPEAVQELAELCKRAGRREGDIVEKMSQGTIHAFHEIEEGPFFLAVKSTLDGIVQQNARRAAANAKD